MAIVYVALGSNVGIGDEQFDTAVKQLSTQLHGIVEAPRYRSKAVGFVDQPDFLNTALRAETSLSPQDLLTFTQSVEQAVGRIRRFRWGPREIDIDIIFYDDLVLNEAALTIPHPRFSERDFVLKPIVDVSPTFIDPVSGRTVHELYEQLAPELRAIKD